MRLVERPAIYPMRCAVLPQLGNTRSDLRWIDTGAEMTSAPRDQRVYLSEPAVREAAKLLGFTTPATVHTLREERDNARLALAKAEAENETLREQLAAVRVLETAGFTVTKES